MAYQANNAANSNPAPRQIRRKLSKYSPEPVICPSMCRLLGSDRMALFSFIQSINTTWDIGLEQVAVIIATNSVLQACRQTIQGVQQHDQREPRQ